MMSASIRRKALSLCSSALTNNGQLALAGSAARGYVAGIPLFEAFVGRSKLVPGIYQGAPVYSKRSRDADFPIQKWIRSFSTYSESGVRGDTYEPLFQVQTDKCNFASEIEKTDNKRTHSGPAFFTASGAAVVGSVLSTPIVNAPQAAKLGVGSTVSSTFLPNLVLFWHINNGIEEILADYVHHEMTRSLVLVLMRLFLIVAAKDVFVATN